MFNQERFDDLARALVTKPLSRWQVLKTFGAGVIGGLAGPLLLSGRVAKAQVVGCQTSADCPMGQDCCDEVCAEAGCTKCTEFCVPEFFNCCPDLTNPGKVYCKSKGDEHNCVNCFTDCTTLGPDYRCCWGSPPAGRELGCINIKEDERACGGCLKGPCQQGLHCCDGVCTDLSVDVKNCGKCYHPCSQGDCCNGDCCADRGLTCCGGQCVDTNTNPNNCGALCVDCEGGVCCNGFCCAPGKVCLNGKCECPVSCAPPHVQNPQTCQCECSVSCFAPRVPNPQTCQCECGNPCSDGTCCDPGTTCCGGICCSSGTTCCNGTCCDPSSTCCGNGICCPLGTTCCGDTCCDLSSTCCSNGICCPLGTTCCGNTCCDIGDTCCADGNGCCAASHNICCPDGQTCCPANLPFCYAGGCWDWPHTAPPSEQGQRAGARAAGRSGGRQMSTPARKRRQAT